MRVFIFIFLFSIVSTNLSAQSREKDYAILEAVIRKENAINLFQQVYNSGLMKATDSLRSFTGAVRGKFTGLDSIVRWESGVRERYLQQLSTPLTTWDKKKIYFGSLVAQDVIAEVTREGKTNESLKNNTYQILRVSQPLYQDDQSAMVYVEFEMMGVVNNTITYKNRREGIYFLKTQKGKWKITQYVGKVDNK
jgi:hypothetical protein